MRAYKRIATEEAWATKEQIRLFRKLLAEELAKVKNAGAEGKLDEGAKLFEKITTDDQYVEFLTLPAYRLID